MDARKPRALPPAPALEIRQLVRKEMGERGDARRRGRGIEDDLDQSREGVVLDDDDGTRRFPGDALQRRFARSAALPM